jgi:Na+/alanine symporter
VSAESWVGGVRREFWDDTTRLYTTWNAAGVQTSQRAYTPAEAGAADAAAAAATARTNEATLVEQLRLTIDALITSRATLKATVLDPTNATINSNPAAVIKAVAKAVRDDEQTLLRLCRVIARQLDSTDTGAAVAAP